MRPIYVDRDRWDDAVKFLSGTEFGPRLTVRDQRELRLFRRGSRAGLPPEKAEGTLREAMGWEPLPARSTDGGRWRVSWSGSYSGEVRGAEAYCRTFFARARDLARRGQVESVSLYDASGDRADAWGIDGPNAPA